ncbi:MAG TPA: hypothetical protein VFL96_01285, partial [Acidobacteriaceae bacterium]|nr:hypothetical protein [Acidobacteriaceae bacterium]
MNIQVPNQTGAFGGRQQNRVAGSMGGNLQFNMEPGGAMRNTLSRTFQSIRYAGMLLYSLASPADEDQRVLREALSLIDTGSEVQALTMLDHLRASLSSAIHAQAQPELRQLQARLTQAAHAQDRLVVARALYDLNALVDRSRQAYGPLPDALTEDVRALINGSRHLFRDFQRNPAGPLNVASLERLDDLSFVYLRRASSLHFLGLELDRQAASAVAHARVAALRWQAVENMMEVLRTLSEEAVDISVLIPQLRNLSGLELQRIQQLRDLGEFAGGGPGPDECRAMARRTCQLAMEELFRTSRQALIVQNAMRHMMLLMDMEGIFGAVASGLESVLDQEDYRSGGAETLRQVVMTQHLLSGMNNEMNQRLLGLLSGRASSDTDIRLYVEPIQGMIPSPAAATLLNEMNELPLNVPYEDFVEALNAQYPELESQASLDPDASARFNAIYRALREQYGVAYDPTQGRAAVTVTDSARATMVPRLRILPFAGPRAPRTFTLTVGGVGKVFTVGQAFHEAAIERGNIRLSVRGVGEAGQAIRFVWPAGLSEWERPRAMGYALDALARVARSSTEPLTRLMDLGRISAILRDSLQEMGGGSPFRLDDGTVVQPEGDGLLILDVAQNEDWSFRLATTLRIIRIRSVKGARADGAAVIVNMNPRALNWAEVHFTLHVAPDARWVRVVGLPQFRHYLDVNDIVPDPTRLHAGPLVH